MKEVLLGIITTIASGFFENTIFPIINISEKGVYIGYSIISYGYIFPWRFNIITLYSVASVNAWDYFAFIIDCIIFISIFYLIGFLYSKTRR